MPTSDPQPWQGWRYLDEARGVETFRLLKAAVTDALAVPVGGRAKGEFLLSVTPYTVVATKTGS